MQQNYLKVSQLTRLLNDTLELYVGEAYFEGELQEITRASSGHLYCTIKDELSTISIVLWSSTVRQLKFRPEKGMQVRCQGKPNVYQKSGRLQVVVTRMEPAGEGLLAQKFEELRKRLATEGLFAAERKRQIPFLPKGIGLVSSAQGAVVHDIMTRLQDRMPHIPVFLIDVRVQGEGAAQEISSAIRFFSEFPEVDVLICARGGGSLQDLWAFNEEVVVRAIFASKLPVISAVGHEVDVTLADLVADLRAPTPTAAAEMVVPSKRELLRILQDVERRLYQYDRWLMPKSQELDEAFVDLERAVLKRIESLKLNYAVLCGRLLAQSPRRLVKVELIKLSKLETRMLSALLMRIEKDKNNLRFYASKLDPIKKMPSIELSLRRVVQLHTALYTLTFSNLERAKRDFSIASSKLESLNPRSVLERGYSVVRKKGQVLNSVAQAKKGDALEIELLDGRLSANVSGKI